MTGLRLLEPTQAEPASRMISDQEGAAMARAVVRLFGHWGVTDRQATVILGGLSMRTYGRWKSGEVGRLDRDLKARLSNLMGIHKALRTIFTETSRAYSWVSLSNDTFDGRSALDVMMDGDLTDLMRVRRSLDAELELS